MHLPNFNPRLERMKKLLLILTCFASTSLAAQPTTVPPAVMDSVYQEIRTPHKYGLILTGTDRSKKLDCPTVFRKGRNWYTTYIAVPYTQLQLPQNLIGGGFRWLGGNSVGGGQLT